MTIPAWLTGHIDEKSLAVIRDAVTQAEEHTTGEIVPMIVRSSSPKGHLAGLLCFLFIATFDLIFFIYLSQFDVGHIIEVQIGVILMSFIFGISFARLSFVQRLLTPKSDRHHNAIVRAELEFHRSQIRATSAHTGVLLFVSLMERQAVVLADEKIVKKLNSHNWDGVLKTLTQGLSARDFAVGFSKAIGQTGLILREHFPASEHSKNDLPNDLQIRE